MNTPELIREIADRNDLTLAQTERTIKTFISILRGEVQGDGRICIPDLGTFTLRNRAATTVDFGKGKTYICPPRKTIHFQPSLNWKRAINLK